ncbi:SprT family zinc-dependent metalloprotease [Xylella fastidiosa]|uniref:YgjP family zinc-dependent metalloprotease n=1 Tax=Xylella fastidiosa TaxID=2371 RepID=UPI000484FB9E|nr:SprT family zinc-dependent metalloprotease [Xylella fastidiosa]MDC7971207.1 SprT family zinc-dependent metalloprotease [Xylella fastidiosa subsp. multiplex]WDF06463.1 SprT family zinc-dependent metalloprotease [Xylella fastidiosa subsp. multiplex]
MLGVLFADSSCLMPPTNQFEHDNIPLQTQGCKINVLCVRNPRARRIKLSVDERGVRLTLPPCASLDAGTRFLLEQRAWIETQIARYASGTAAIPLRRGETTTLPLRDQQLPLHWHESRYTRLELDAHGLQFYITTHTNDNTLRRTLKEFYEVQARVDINDWLRKYLPGLPRPPTRVRLKPMSSQWGSLATDGHMALDLALVLGRPSAFEYVVVHELCHLIQANHSPAFWREVECRFPLWREERDYFHLKGRILKAQLRRLLQTE